MVTSVTCYPVAGKPKSLEICRTFAEGCGGTISYDCSRLVDDGPSFFYGVEQSNLGAWNAAKANLHHDFYYSDNSYFDSTRQTYFRVTKNGLQHSGFGKSDGKRFADLKLEIKPWRKSGEHIVICPQSEHFMQKIAGVYWNWTQATMKELALHTKRKMRVRPWSPDKGKLAKTLLADLIGAHAMVVWSSAAAITAALFGIPVICTGPCAARAISGAIHEIDNPPTPPREQWAGVLADNQWTLAEMQSGVTWKALNG